MILNEARKIFEIHLRMEGTHEAQRTFLHQYHPHLEHEFKHYMLSYNQGYSQKPSIFLVSIYDVCGRLQNILN